MSTTLKNNIKKKTSGISKNGTKKKTSRLNGTASVSVCRHDIPGPVRIKGESDEQREKRLAKRKALTLKLLQAAYENHQRQKG
ncbi:MAG: hypothetical protein ACKVRN_11230 [Pyrinomonadaceae bacterium]